MLGFWGGRGAWGGRVLHGRLTTEHNLHFLVVELSLIGQVHDALPVVGELLDAHLLQGRKRGGRWWELGTPFLPAEHL